MTDAQPLRRQDIEEVVRDIVAEIIRDIVPGMIRDIVPGIVRDMLQPLEARLDRLEKELHEFRDATLTRLDHLIGLYERSDQERTFMNGTLNDHESRIQALEGR